LIDISFLKGLKFYVQAENLVTFSKWRGWDPEVGFRGTDRGIIQRLEL
jgi:hypothetical protein